MRKGDFIFKQPADGVFTAAAAEVDRCGVKYHIRPS